MVEQVLVELDLDHYQGNKSAVRTLVEKLLDNPDNKAVFEIYLNTNNNY